MQFGKNLTAVRKKWRLTQVDFGDFFGLGRGPIFNYEKDHNEPSLSFIIQLYEATRIPIYDLLVRELLEEEIPEKPYTEKSDIKAIIPKKREFPLDNNIEEPLYNHHLMVKKMKELEGDMAAIKKKVEDIEKRK